MTKWMQNTIVALKAQDEERRLKEKRDDDKRERIRAKSKVLWINLTSLLQQDIEAYSDAFPSWVINYQPVEGDVTVIVDGGTSRAPAMRVTITYKDLSLECLCEPTAGNGSKREAFHINFDFDEYQELVFKINGQLKSLEDTVAFLLGPFVKPDSKECASYQ